MAKLSAHGTEQARITKISASTEAGMHHRTTLVLMSDNVVLQKIDYNVTALDKARKHSSGWKRHAKLRAGLTVEGWLAFYGPQGYTRA